VAHHQQSWVSLEGICEWKKSQVYEAASNVLHPEFSLLSLSGSADVQVITENADVFSAT
jgi:hypothetical protein